ncbi:MAG TPA: acyltransferase [Rhizomicrobium sp.]|nr:acyltransferase [Rhizomicrobium sp.]
MRKEFSAYLDLLRITAAALVFLGHLSWRDVSGGFLWPLQPYGHSAVIIFFVLSGFVISFTADTKERTLLDYSAARLARLYSVVLPALILTLICDAIGTAHNPGVYYMDRETEPFWRLLAGSLFLTQSWNHVSLLSNDPYWSLPHEFWYYAIFAAATYLRGKQRICAIAASSLIAGPGILLLGPIWGAGVIAYRMTKRITVGTIGAASIWGVTTIAGVMVGIANITPDIPTSLYLPNAYSWWDFVLGVLVAANIFSASFLSFGLAPIQRPIAYLAGMTFALYLFHLPLLHLAAAYMPQGLTVTMRGLIAAVFALSIIYALSFITEGQKRRWKAAILSILGRFSGSQSAARTT